MAAKRLTERVEKPFAGCRVNREAGTVEGVLICGTASANGRDYPPEVFRRDFRAYEGRPVNCDHGREATVDRRFGWFAGVTVGEDGRPRGTLHALKSHPMFERVMEAAERNPALYGFSHVAMCDTRRDKSGREVIEAIRGVESIDLVAEPATTQGLFEGRTVPFTIKLLAERVAKHPKSTTEQILKAKRLAEMDGVGDVAIGGDAPPEDQDPNEAITSGFKAAIMAVIEQAMSGDLDPKAALAKVKTLLNSHGDATSEPGKKEPEEPDEPTPESKQKPKAADPIAVLEECKKLGYDPGVAELKALCLMEAADRVAYTREQMKKVAEARAEKPKSGGRNPGGGTRTTEAKAPAGPPKDVSEFMSRITG